MITHPEENVISNSFVFFGHTDYGGDGGEGSFFYPENKARYEAALKEYCTINKINNPTTKDYNAFQDQEIKKFITHHPFKWVGLQFTKFFRTFGVVPESASFKILYTGLFKDRLWLTSIVIVAPVTMIILLFIVFFDLQGPRRLVNGTMAQWRNGAKIPPAPCFATRNPGFTYIYLTLFIYYIIATVFYGQYQERYRMPLMVVFIIPLLGYFIATFNRKKFFNRTTLAIKGAVIILFLTVWVFQARKAISNKQRLENAIEVIKDVKK